MSLEKKDSYYDVGIDLSEFANHSFQPEVEALFRKVVKEHEPIERLLDVGCASGRTSLFSKRLGVKELVGIELDPRGAEIASKYFDRVIVGDVSQVELDFEVDYFDMLFLTDILEHLVDPWQTLKRFVDVLKPGGWVIVALPNINHRSIITALVAGRFTYQHDGLLDSGHLRFFTQDEAIKMFTKAGLEPISILLRIDQDDWERYKDSNRIPLYEGLATLEIDPAKIPNSVKQTYFTRKFNFLLKKRNI